MHRVATVLCALALHFLTNTAAAEPPDVKDLLKKQLETATRAMELADQEYRLGRRGIENTIVWAKRVRDAKLALSENKNDRIAAHEAYVKRVQDLEKAMKQQL